MDRQDGTQPTVAIYALRDPRNGSVRYVGQTRGTLERRLQGHLHEARDGKSSNAGKREWIRGLLYAGLVPAIELLALQHDVVSIEQRGEPYVVCAQNDGEMFLRGGR